jgi:hypothetical protein
MPALGSLIIGATVVVLASTASPHAAPLARAHPLHTTFTELNWDGSTHRITITIRLFTEDFAAAVGRRAHRAMAGGPDATIPDSLSFEYVGAALVLSDRSGRPVPLIWRGAHRVGDVSFLSLQATLAGGPSGLRIVNSIHCELFEDQVNIVKADYGNRSESLLFVRGDPQKIIP